MDFTDSQNWVQFFETDITSAQRIPAILIENEINYEFIKVVVENPNGKSTWSFGGYLSFLLFSQDNLEIGDRQSLLNNKTKIFKKPEIIAFTYKLQILPPYYFRRYIAKVYGIVQKSKIYVNCGGFDYIDSQGQLWLADFGVTGGMVYRYSLINITDPLPTPDLVNDPTLWEKERSGSYFRYVLPCANGYYTVKLYFAEVGFLQVGKRVFRVKINGQTVIDNFDIFSEVGKGQGLLKLFFSQQVSNGLMEIEFIGVVDNATITAIAIF